MSIIQTTESGNGAAKRSTLGKIGGWIARGLGVILAALIAVLLAVPVILLPIATAVPVFVWAPIAVSCGGLLAARLLYPARLGVAAMFAALLVLAVLAVVVSQTFATTPAITDASGRPILGSIAVLEKVTLNGSEQWITIRGKDMTKPVLLFLSGGPGGSQLVVARRVLAGLEDHFVVVNWEQPGAGKSFDAVNRSTLTPERYIQDGRALVMNLRERFKQDKVYILGESWGSALGIWMVQRDPQLYHAFIGTGQMVAFLENDLICYNWALNLARERGNLKQVEKLERQGPPPYYGDGVAWKESAFLMDTFNYMNANPAISDDGFNTFGDLAGDEYGLYDKVSWFRGALETLNAVYPQLWEVDFRKQVASLSVPVYFLLGRHDVNAPPALAEEYFKLLTAPKKELIWFERSGHNPWVNESARFVEVVVNTVLAQTQPAR